MEIKKITMIGQGALGILFGKKITDAVGKENMRYLADQSRIDRYQKSGVTCNGELCDFGYVTPEEKGDPADLVIFAVKGPTLAEAIRNAKYQIGSRTILLSLMNGISSEAEIGKVYGTDNLLYCVAQGMDATRAGNTLIYTKAGELIFGEMDGSRSENVKAVAALFDKSGISYEIPQDMNRIMWKKFMMNVGVNQAVTAFESSYGGVQIEGEPRRTMQEAMREVITIANLKGIDLNESDIDYWMNVLAHFGKELKPSMAQDADAKRKTEVDLFAGTVIRIADQLGVQVPVNRWLYQRIHEIESKY
jgi:2-dehydropantoate 2-reductase